MKLNTLKEIETVLLHLIGCANPTYAYVVVTLKQPTFSITPWACVPLNTNIPYILTDFCALNMILKHSRWLFNKIWCSLFVQNVQQLFICTLCSYKCSDIKNDAYLNFRRITAKLIFTFSFVIVEQCNWKKKYKNPLYCPWFPGANVSPWHTGNWTRQADDEPMCSQSQRLDVPEAFNQEVFSISSPRVTLLDLWSSQ